MKLNIIVFLPRIGLFSFCSSFFLLFFSKTGGRADETKRNT
nr:MAG TPA: hypothetical protein [Caudoviricetes sp.]DAR83168.1 MAG TPA: hypothetical protein [Caudoviricetes sp.]